MFTRVTVASFLVLDAVGIGSWDRIRARYSSRCFEEQDSVSTARQAAAMWLATG